MRRKKNILFLLLSLVVILVVSLFIACDDGLQVSDNKEMPSLLQNKVEQEKEIIYFGVISRYNPVLMYKRYQPVMDYLSEKTPYIFKLKLGSTYEEAVNNLHYNITQVASLGGVTFSESFVKFGARAILRSKNENGKGYYQSYIVTRKDNEITSLKDLIGKTFAFASIKSTSGNLYPRYLLWKNGINLEDLKYVNLKHHDAVAVGVLKGKYFAGALKDVAAKSFLAKGLKVIAKSEPIPSVPIVVSKDADPKMVSALKKALLAVDPEKPEFKDIVKDWDDEFKYGFIEASNDDYKVILKMIRDIPAKCGESCHPKNIFAKD
ncbi:MAG: phosphate/phosphite/phosphonate ABC transporter substrate-binding protein [Candidatus Schekmanbacteria bacterium]|nr:MAG: phosphate/phosphite/phosphonate ABC transporter substrate-binding protein [Candidatus Schekmanbacteria bacterium]